MLNNKIIVVMMMMMMSIPSGVLIGQVSEGEFIFNDPMPFVLTTDSKVWLEGSANVINFECRATEITTFGSLAGLDTLSQVPAPHGDINLEVRIPVRELDCGRSGINRDMRNTLNVSQHPFITYKLDRNSLIGLTTEDELFVFDIDTWGNLQISGNDREEQIHVTGKFLGPWQFQIKGSHDIKMSEFGLVPPSPMMGLIKVDDTMTVHFDVTFCLRSCDTVVSLN